VSKTPFTFLKIVGEPRDKPSLLNREREAQTVKNYLSIFENSLRVWEKVFLGLGLWMEGVTEFS
jgi:hypothetical protein